MCAFDSLVAKKPNYPPCPSCGLHILLQDKEMCEKLKEMLMEYISSKSKVVRNMSDLVTLIVKSSVLPEGEDF